MQIFFVFFVLGFSAPNAFADASKIFQTECAQCHSLEAVNLQDSGTSAVGPSLYGIVDRPAAQESDYSYSEALLTRAAAGLVWDVEVLNKFLSSPAREVPGTKMAYKGLHKKADRELLISWLGNPDNAVNDSEAKDAVTISPDVERILSVSADPDYGEYLGAECATCHSGSAAAGGVPPINGLPNHYFVQALLDYKNGVRDNSVMKLMAGNLGDEEMAALAAHFASQP